MAKSSSVRPVRSRARIRAAASIAGLAIALAAVPAGAQVWEGLASEHWDNPFNWPLGGVPDGDADVIIDRQDPFAPVISQPDTDIADRQITVGVAGTARLTIESTGALSNGTALLGQNASSQGTVIVNGGRWTNSGTLFVGLLGTGTLQLSGGGSVSAGSMAVGVEADGASRGVGMVTVAGTGSRLETSGLFGIGDRGTGTVRVSGGATAGAGQLRLGMGSGGNGTLIVDGAGSAVEAGDLAMGREGRAFVTIGNGGRLTTGDAVVDRAGSSAADGLFTVTGAGSAWTANGPVAIGGAGGGELLVADGGAVLTRGDATLGNNPGAYGIVTVDAGRWTGERSLRVGVLGSGTLDVLNGGDVAMQRISIGTVADAAPEAFGEAFVTGSGSTLTASGEVRIGDNGRGTLHVTDGATASGSGLFVAAGTGSTGDGTLLIDGAGSSVSAGAFGTGFGGKAFVTVSGGGQLTTGDSIVDRLGTDDMSGLLTVTGAGSRWTVNGFTAIGGIRNGAMVVSDGGQVDSRTGGSIGNDEGAVGSVLVTGEGSLWRIQDPEGTGDFGFLIGAAGTADLRIEEGGRVEANGSVFVSNAAGQTSGITLDGAGSRLVSNGGLQIGSRGDATVTVGNGSQLVTNGATSVASGLGSSAGIDLAGGANWTTVGRADVGVLGAADLSITDGATADFGGVFTLAGASTAGGSTLVVDGADSRMTFATEAFLGFGGSASVTISNGAGIVAADLTPVPGHPFSKGLWIGSASAVPEGQPYERSVVDLTITGEGSRLAVAGYVRVGESGTVANVLIADGASFSTETAFKIAPGLTLNPTTQAVDVTEGYVTVTDPGSRLSADFLSVGDPAGKGRLSVLNGAEVRSQSTTIGNGAGSISGRDGTYYSDGAVLVSGEGSRWINTSEGSGPVSGVIGTAAGTGVLRIEKGGHVETRALQLGNYGAGGGSGPVHGTLIIGAAAGEAPVAAGTIGVTDAISFAQGDDVSSTLVFNHSDTDYVFGARMTADAGYDTASQGLIRHLAGTTTLTADSSGFTGVTELTGGRLLVQGALGGRILVGAGGYLGGSGRIGTTVFGNGATLAPGEDAIGTMRFTGLELSAGTIFEVQVTDQGASDRVEVSDGPVVLGGATLRIRDAAGGAFAGRDSYIYTLIDNQGAGAVTGSFGTITNELAFLSPTVNYAGGSGNDVVLTLTQTSLFPDVAATPNQRAVADALQAFGTAPGSDAAAVYREILFMTEPEAQRLFTLAAGEAHASLQVALAETGGLYTRSLERRAAFARGRGRGLWLGPLAHDARLRGDGNAARLESRSLGLAGGVDLVAMDVGADGRAVMGLSAGYLEGDADVAGRLSKADGKSTLLGAYAALSSGSFRLSAAFSMGWHELSLSRGIQSAGIDRTARSRRDARTIGFAGTVQYDMPLGAAARLSPFAMLRIDNVDLDATAESGAGALDLTVERANFTDARAGGGVELGYEAGAVALGVRVAYEAGIGDRRAGQKSALAGGGPLFEVLGPYGRSDGVVAGADASVGLGTGVSLGLSYDGRFGDGLRRHRGMASLTIGF